MTVSHLERKDIYNPLLKIEGQQYEAALENREISREQIQKLGFAFEGKTVLIKFFSPNLTGEYVSRIEKKALGKLREKFEQE